MSVLSLLVALAVPSAGVVASMRRWFTPVSWRIALLFYVMTLVFLHGAVFTGKLPVPVDEIVRGYPYVGITGEPSVRNPLTNDTVKLFLPWMAVVREEFAGFRAPLWNRYSFSGYPLLANGESAPFSPLFLATIFVPLPHQIVAMAGLKIFVSLLFGYLFVRRVGAGEAAACFASTAFAWSVFQTVFLYYSTTAVTAFLPAALYAILVAQQEGSRRGMVLVSLVVASLMANGHPESVLHIAIVAAGLLAVDVALASDRRAWLRNFRAPFAGALAGLALSAPAWVPVLEQVLLSSRLAELRRVGGHPAMYPLTAAWALISPNGFGNPVRQNWSWILNYSSVATSYTGLVVLVLVVTAALGRKTGSRERLWLLFAVLLWLVAMSWSPLGRGLNALPPFSFVANDKLRFGALFIGAAVAAVTVDRLRARRSAMLVIVTGAVVGLALFVFKTRPDMVRPSDLVPPIAVTTFTVTAIAWRRAAPVAAFLAVAIELLTLNHGFNALVDARYDKPDLPILAALRRAAPAEPYRIAGLDWTFLPNASARYGFEDIRGSDPMSYAAYTEMIRPLVVDDPAIDVDRVVNVEDPLLDRLGVRFLLTDPGVVPGGRWRSIYEGPDGTLYENEAARSRFFVRSGDAAVRVVQLSPAHLRVVVEATTPALVGSSQVGVRGWRVDGGPAVKRIDDGIFVGFQVERGVHRIDVRYLPFSFYGSLAGTGLGLALLLLAGRWNTDRGHDVLRCP